MRDVIIAESSINNNGRTSEFFPERRDFSIDLTSRVLSVSQYLSMDVH